MEVIKLWIQYSSEMVSYLESLGLTTEVHTAPDSHVGGSNMEYYVPSLWHTLEAPEGSEFAGSLGCVRNSFLENYINEKGYEIQYSMSLVKLVQEDSGKVTGAIFSDVSGAYVQINAENVILATGGYPGNPKMIKALAPIVDECVTANSYFGPDGVYAAIFDSDINEDVIAYDQYGCAQSSDHL